MTLEMMMPQWHQNSVRLCNLSRRASAVLGSRRQRSFRNQTAARSFCTSFPEFKRWNFCGCRDQRRIRRILRQAANPILPLTLFANKTFVVSCTVGLIVGMAMFGSVTYLPLYLQTVKDVDPSVAGLQLTPMMGGVLVSSMISGQIISRTGKYRLFPIAGTAVMTVGLLLLSTLGVDTPTWQTSGYALVLGLGLGMVMQVLVLAVQNSVDYPELESGLTTNR